MEEKRDVGDAVPYRILRPVCRPAQKRHVNDASVADALDVRVDELVRAEHSAPAADRDTETLSIVQAAADLVRSRAQEQTAGVLAVFMIVLMSVQSFFAESANAGGSVFYGGIAAVSPVSVYYYMENRADRTSRTIYAVSAALSAAVFVLLCVLT